MLQRGSLNYQIVSDIGFQTPSAGRWVLQLNALIIALTAMMGFKPHQRGGGCCSTVVKTGSPTGAAAFQTPSAGRWVLQPSL